VQYHYGITIREAREKLQMTQAQLAEQWPQAGGGTGVSVNYVSDVERGIKNISDPQTLRRLCKLLQIPLWKMGLSEYDPFQPESFTESLLYQGIIKSSESLIKRIWNLRRLLPLPYLEQYVDDLNRLFTYIRQNNPPNMIKDSRFLVLYAQVLRLNAVIFVEKQQYEEALKTFYKMHEVAKESNDSATIAMSYLNIGTELERMGKQEEAIEYLELGRDESFHSSKHIVAVVHSYLARVYASAKKAVKFQRAIDTALRVAHSIENFSYGDGTDFVFHSLSGILAEKSYGYLEIDQPEETLKMKEEIQKQIILESNIWLNAWIPLDWARAHLMLGQIHESVQAGIDFYTKAKALQSPHAQSRAFQLLDKMKKAGYGNDPEVRKFQEILSQKKQ
jgi:transcriptional regulator with XRE-family HTH domain